jgi:multisubunit Na+/H+ antiporter MnhB subunit
MSVVSGPPAGRRRASGSAGGLGWGAYVIWGALAAWVAYLALGGHALDEKVFAFGGMLTAVGTGLLAMTGRGWGLLTKRIGQPHPRPSPAAE